MALSLMSSIKDDEEKHSEWFDIIDKTLKFLGFEVEDKSINSNSVVPNSKNVSNKTNRNLTYDTTFAISVLKLWSSLRCELFPIMGPVGLRTNIDNSSKYNTSGDTIKDFLNNYLTQVDKGYYADCDRFLLYLIVYGCVFKKTYLDPSTKLPIARFVNPKDLIIDKVGTSIDSCVRMTHVLYLTKRDIILRIRSGLFDKNVDWERLFKSGTKNTDTEDKDAEDSSETKYKFYETSCYLNFTDFDEEYKDDEDIYVLPSPYIVTIAASLKIIVSMIPNWEETDETKTAIEYLVHYNLYSGF